MIKNMGSVDRIARGIIGIALITFGYLKHAWWGWLGVIPLGTALISWCPLYLPFKINTGAKTPTPKAG